MQRINKALVVALLVVAPAAYAQQTGITVQEARAIQGRVALAELEAKVREAQNRGLTAGPNGPMPSPISVAPSVGTTGAARIEEPQFVGHYGIEDNLKADFLLNGALVTFSLNGESEIGGWKLTSLTPRQARLCRIGSNKGTGCKTVLLSAERPTTSGEPSNAGSPVIPLPSTIAAAK